MAYNIAGNLMLGSISASAFLAMAPSTTSVVWKYFTGSLLDPSKAVCCICQKEVSRGTKGKSLSTTPLWNHLNRHHKDKVKDLGSPDSPDPKQTKPSSSTAIGSSKQVSLDSRNNLLIL